MISFIISRRVFKYSLIPLTPALLTKRADYMNAKIQKINYFSAMAAAIVLTGCAGGGGYPNNNIAGFGAQPAASPMNAIEGALLNNLAGSVLNGGIGSQLQPQDQSFRVQQLSNMVQNGSIGQSQQWVNPQTGSSMAINPIGQNVYNQATQQQCQHLQEVVTMPNGQSITENRVACQDPQTGQWALVK
jgi:surface antigen